jgi:AraC-like DNA-binding protein
MIETLTNSDFNSYGKVLNLGFKEACAKENISADEIIQLNLTAKSLRSLICTNKCTSFLNLLEGLAILCVSMTPLQKDIKVFLLDKPVTINSGIFYNVVPLYGVCSIQIGKQKHEEFTEHFLTEDFTPLGIYPKVNINNVYTLFYQDKEKNFLFKGEKHNFWELTYVDKGTLYNNIDGKTYVTKQGELIFYKENQYHIQWTDETHPASFVTITFSMDFYDSNILSDRIFALDDDMKNIIKNIIHEKNDGLYYNDDVIICYLKILIIRLIRNDKLESTIHSLKGVVKDKIENSLVANITEYIEANIDRKLTIPDIAKQVHLSQSYLSTIFKQNMDITIVDYINKLKLEKSKHLLRTSKYSITEISEMLGYNSIHYFSRQFKLHFGVSPSAYANSCKD